MSRRGQTPSRKNRRSPVRDPKRKMILVIEGKNTEPDYFHSLARRHQNKFASIDVRSASGVPETIANKCLDISIQIQNAGADSLEAGDEVWAVFDRDTHPQFWESVERCKQKRVMVAYSIPCFEYWLFLHFADCNAPQNQAQMQALLKGKSASYKKSSRKCCDFEELENGITMALKRAKTGRKALNEEGAEERNPSTTVDLLVKKIQLEK